MASISGDGLQLEDESCGILSSCFYQSGVISGSTLDIREYWRHKKKWRNTFEVLSSQQNRAQVVVLDE